jgi:hypothetical protein
MGCPKPGKIPKLIEPGDGHRRYAAGGYEIDGRPYPRCVRIPCVNLVQRDEANNPKSDNQAYEGYREAITLDVVPSPNEAPDEQRHDADRDGNGCGNLQASAVLVPTFLLEYAAQETFKPVQEAESARRLHQRKHKKRSRQSRPDQRIRARHAVALRSPTSDRNPKAEQAGDYRCRNTEDINRHRASYRELAG